MSAARLRDDQFQKFVVFSLSLHLTFFMLYAIKAVVFPTDIIVIPDAIRVDLVGMPDKIQSKPPAAPAPEPIKIPEKAKPEIAKKPRNIKAEQKKAMDALKQREALESIKNLVHSKPAETPTDLKPNQPQYKGNVIASGNSFTGISGLVAQEYWGQIKRHAQNFWTLPEWLMNQPLKASIVIRLDPNGRVVQTDIYKSSGNQAFDMAAISAVEAASPFPVPPDKIRDTIAQSWIVLNLPE